MEEFGDFDFDDEDISENITPIGDGNWIIRCIDNYTFFISENITPIGDGN